MDVHEAADFRHRHLQRVAAEQAWIDHHYAGIAQLLE